MFTLLPLPCIAVVGAAFKVGVRVEMDVEATDYRIWSRPFCTLMSASLAADVVVAAGVTGRMTFAGRRGQNLWRSGAAGDRDGLYAYANAVADLGLKASKGRSTVLSP